MVVGDEEVIRRGARPGRIDFNRVSDDSDDGDFFSTLEESFENVWVNGVGANDEVGEEFVEKCAQRVFGWFE